jgi:hypothetical protein
MAWRFFHQRITNQSVLPFCASLPEPFSASLAHRLMGRLVAPLAAKVHSRIARVVLGSPAPALSQLKVLSEALPSSKLDPHEFTVVSNAWR